MAQSLRDEVFRYVKRKYKSEIEHLWANFPNYTVFRRRNNRKWYGTVMDISRSKLGLPEEDVVDVLNVKMDSPLLADFMTQQDGIFPGYHFSGGSWISVLLDGTVDMAQIRSLIDRSYNTVARGKRQRKDRMQTPES